MTDGESIPRMDRSILFGHLYGVTDRRSIEKLGGLSAREEDGEMIDREFEKEIEDRIMASGIDYLYRKFQASRLEKDLSGHSTAAPTRQEYYKDKPTLTIGEQIELFQQESRDAAGILSRAALHVVDHNAKAAAMIHMLRSRLLQDECDFGAESDTARFRTMFLYRALTVGIPPVMLKNAQVLNRFPPPGR